MPKTCITKHSCTIRVISYSNIIYNITALPFCYPGMEIKLQTMSPLKSSWNAEVSVPAHLLWESQPAYRSPPLVSIQCTLINKGFQVVIQWVRDTGQGTTGKPCHDSDLPVSWVQQGCGEHGTTCCGCAGVHQAGHQCGGLAPLPAMPTPPGRCVPHTSTATSPQGLMPSLLKPLHQRNLNS